MSLPSLLYASSQSDNDKVFIFLKQKKTKTEWSYLVGIFYSLLKNKRFSKTMDAVAASGLTLD
jgi:hypothetical protein